MPTHEAKSPRDFGGIAEILDAGDTIKIIPGLFEGVCELRDKTGIFIGAAADEWISGGRTPDPAWGGGLPEQDSPRRPNKDDCAFLRLMNCRDIVIDGLKLHDFWPVIVFMQNCSNVTIRNCCFKHGNYAIFAKGNAKEDGPSRTRGYVVENNSWQQDDSPDHRLWSFYDWADSHGGEGGSGKYRYFNGGFFGGRSIGGDIVIRGNVIMDAYNGVRIKGDDTGTKFETLPNLNANVHIYDNNFIRIRDNPIEPETYAVNWHVRHNRLVDCHSWFSVDGVAGGYWYIYGNTGTFVSRQGANPNASHTMGRVLKLSYETFASGPQGSSAAVPKRPWYVFNNSWYLRCPLIGGSDPAAPGATEGEDFTAHLAFFNNAIEWCGAAHHGERVCEATDLVMQFDWGRSEDVSFDHDICNRGDFKRFLSAPGKAGERNGIVAVRSIFHAGPGGAFQLAPDSQAQATGTYKELLRKGASAAHIEADGNGKLNMGAHQTYGLTSVPALEDDAMRILAGDFTVA